MDEATFERLRLSDSKTRLFCPSESKEARFQASLIQNGDCPHFVNPARSAFHTVFSSLSLRLEEEKAKKSGIVLSLKAYLSPFFDGAGRSKMFEHEGIKGYGFLICTDIPGTQGAFMRSFESAEEDGQGMALKI